MKLHAEGLRGRKKILRLVSGKITTGWVHQKTHDTRSWKHLVQHFQQLRCHLCVRLGHARDISARAAEAGDKAEPDWISRRFKDDWNLCCRGFCCKCRRSSGRG